MILDTFKPFLPRRTGQRTIWSVSNPSIIDSEKSYRIASCSQTSEVIFSRYVPAVVNDICSDCRGCCFYTWPQQSTARNNTDNVVIRAGYVICQLPDCRLHSPPTPSPLPFSPPPAPPPNGKQSGKVIRGFPHVTQIPLVPGRSKITR